MYVLFDTPLFPDLVQCGKYMLILLKIGFVQVKKKVLFTIITQQNYKKKKTIFQFNIDILSNDIIIKLK